jgi:hypothetical protein
MAGLIKWNSTNFNAIVIDDSSTSGANCLTSLAAGSAALTGTTNFNGSPSVKPTSIDNSSYLAFFLDLQVKLSFAVAPTAGKTVDLYLLYAIDGSTYGGGTSGASPTTVNNHYIGSVTLVNATTQPVTDITGIPIKPYKFQIQIVNSADQALAVQSTGSAIVASVYSEQYS